MTIQIPISQKQIAEFCQLNGIRKLSLFGSVLRDDFRPDSDIDVLVEFMPERIPGFLGIARLERELSELFAQRKIDLRTPEDLSQFFRQRVVSSAEIQYAA